jgi:hypothetical protein
MHQRRMHIINPGESAHHGTSWATSLTFGNYKHMRYADVLLMAAECEAVRRY